MAENAFQSMHTMLREINLQCDDKISNEYICLICKRLMINAHSAPCGCTYCCGCIEQYLDGTDKLCPGDGDDCRDMLLNFNQHIHVDQRMNAQILKLIVKCPDASCEYRGQLKTIPEHVMMSNHQCLYTKCPFCDVGCTEVKVENDKIRDHLNSEMLSHSTLLIQWVSKLMNEIESLARIGEDLGRENISLKEDIQMMKEHSERQNEEIISMKVD